MEIVLTTLLVIAVIIVVLYLVFKRKKRPSVPQPVPDHSKKHLVEYVDFYNNLDDGQKLVFENRMQHFLSTVRITGVNTTVEDLDKTLVAASAIIPIFGFADWEYMNLNEVLLYPDSFNETFDQQGTDRRTLGLVGDGPYQNVMILSKHELRQDFMNKTGKNNTAIHEFVHLVDKTDGAVDGVPEFLLSKKYVVPWLKLMQKKIDQILESRSDINAYGATSEAEFFAVAAEYFFERPDLLESKHPELYKLLVLIFRQQPINNESGEAYSAMHYQ